MARPKKIVYNKKVVSLSKKKPSRKAGKRPVSMSKMLTSSVIAVPRPKLRAMRSNKQLATISLADSIIDPFMGAVCVPDGFEGGCFSLQFQSPLTTDSQGYAAFALTGDPANLFANITGNGVVGAGGGWNIPPASVWTSSTSLATVVNTYSKLRVISMGLKLVCTQSTTTDQGGIVCAQIPGNYLLDIFNAQGPGSFAAVEGSCTNSTTGSLKDGCVVTWRPESSQNTFQYASYYNVVQTFSTAPTIPGTPYLFVGIAGAATGTVCRIEAIVNFQGQYRTVAYLPGNALDLAQEAEVGWMEKTINIIKKIPQFLPLIGDIASAVIPGGGLIGRFAKLALQ